MSGVTNLQTFDEEPVGFFERVRVEQVKHTIEGIVRRCPVFEGKEFSQPSPLLVDEGCKIVIGFSTTTDGDEGGQEDFNERMATLESGLRS